MMKKYVLSSACALMLAGAVASAQSTTSSQQPPQTQPQPQATQHEMMTTTVEGCVYREADIPGRSPNVAERAGVLEDYILVASDSTEAGATGTSGTATGTSAAAGAATAAKAKMYKLEHADDSKLSALVGKRVRVTGKADMEHGDKTATGTAGTDKSMGPDRIELPEFEVASITETTGTCPPKPDVKK